MSKIEKKTQLKIIKHDQQPKKGLLGISCDSAHYAPVVLLKTFGKKVISKSLGKK